jgi:MraZ protein
VVESGRKIVPAFSGKHYVTVDQKGRIIIPASFREIISTNYSTKLYITNALFDKCLYLYPLEEWNMLQENIRTKPKYDEAVRFYMRRIIASATEVEIDRQGRILVPAALREDASIEADIAIVGQTERIEIWNRSEWDAVASPERVDKAAIQMRLTEFGI